MTADEPSWPRARWIRIIALLFAGHLFLAWTLAERTVKRVRETKHIAPVELLTLPSANQAVYQHPSVAAATLFSQVDPRSFSGIAWLRTPPREAPLTEWKEPDFYLAANPDRLGLPFQRFIQTNAPQLTSAAIVPEFQRTPVELTPSPAPTLSRYSFSGELTSRKLLSKLEIPLWPAANSIRSTTIAVAVDASGNVFSAVVERSSGDAAADQQALVFARDLRFAPSPSRQPASPIGADLTWGIFRILWQTTPPAITNAPLP